MIDKASRPYREALALYTRILDDDPEVTADAARERFLAALAETPEGHTIEALCVELGADKLWRDATGKPRQAAARALTGAVLRRDKAGARVALDVFMQTRLQFADCTFGDADIYALDRALKRGMKLARGVDREIARVRECYDQLRAAIDATGDDALTVRGAYERGLLDWERIAA